MEFILGDWRVLEVELRPESRTNRHRNAAKTEAQDIPIETSFFLE